MASGAGRRQQSPASWPQLTLNHRTLCFGESPDSILGLWLSSFCNGGIFDVHVPLRPEFSQEHENLLAECFHSWWPKNIKDTCGLPMGLPTLQSPLYRLTVNTHSCCWCGWAGSPGLRTRLGKLARRLGMHGSLQNLAIPLARKFIDGLPAPLQLPHILVTQGNQELRGERRRQDSGLEAGFRTHGLLILEHSGLGGNYLSGLPPWDLSLKTGETAILSWNKTPLAEPHSQEPHWDVYR